jgi:hypothetical protein
MCELSTHKMNGTLFCALACPAALTDELRFHGRGAELDCVRLVVFVLDGSIFGLNEA